MSHEEEPYPPAPWQMTGQIWAAVAATGHDVRVPGDLTLLMRHRIMLMLVNYTSGTLRYHEAAVGALVRRGWRIGVLVQRVWVDDLSSLWGGRRLWGIPKELADFTWTDSAMSVKSDGEEFLAVEFGAFKQRLPPITLSVVGFGELDGRRTSLRARIRGSFATTTVRITHWSDFLPALSGNTDLRAGTVQDCLLTFPPGRILQ